MIQADPGVRLGPLGDGNAVPGDDAAAVDRGSAWRRASRPSWRSFVRQPAGLIGLVLLTAIALVAVLAGIIAPGDPFRAVARPLLAPAPGHPFGTDDLGRDMLAMVMHGTRTSLLVGLAVALLSGLVGTVVGSLSGFFGGLADDALMRATELVQVVPRFFLILVSAALFGPSITVTILLLGLTSWPSIARLLRSQVLSVREREYVVAARALGTPELRNLARHVLPNAGPIVLAVVALQVGTAILLEAGLSFLGLGDRSLLSWGYLLNNAQLFLRTAWWMSVFPGIAITLTVLAVNLAADGLSDALDPRLRRSSVR